MSLGVIILTGGAASRMGADKAELDWNGRRAVDRLADIARSLGAVVTATAGARSYGLPFAVEDPPGGGPVAGIVAASAVLLGEGCTRALALAVDAPTVLPSDLAPLLAPASPGACFADLHLPLAIDLVALPVVLSHGWSIRRLVEAAGLARLIAPQSAQARLRGANTPAEREALLAALVVAEAAQSDGAG